MATLYVENVPEDLYQALRERAKANQRSIAAETLSLIKQAVPTAADLKRRMALFKEAEKIRKSQPRGVPGASAEEMIREDRER
ncbi:MAG: FitA-like ribbon-helix-helix domain-containing protein [Bryobacteraceae bacterium]